MAQGFETMIRISKESKKEGRGTKPFLYFTANTRIA
jgi:hypothetical protein